VASPPVEIDSGTKRRTLHALVRVEGAGRTVFAAFGFACLLSIVVFPDVWWAMVRVWTNSETFAHGFIALPCAAWMLWRRRADWSNLRPRVWWPAVAALIGCGLLWLVGRLSGVASLEELAVVGTIPATMLLLVGPTVTRSISFPLAFLFFAVPVGEFLTPLMMDLTADATVAAIRWSGVPVFREGLHFSLSSGRWSVVEACSGLRYLIASVSLGVLYAYLQFRTLRYRLAFVALAIVVPIVANWVRAYGIVMLGHLSDMRIATGVDHLIYGWLFFGFVMALLFWIGSRWHEPEMDRNEPAAPLPSTDPSSKHLASRYAIGPGAIFAGAAVALVIAIAWRPLSAGLLDATQPVDAVGVLSAALDPFPRAEPLDFTPQYDNATAAVRSSRIIGGAPVEVHAFYYARQYERQEMIHATHAVVRPEDFSSRVTWQGKRKTPWGEVAAYHIRRGNGSELLVWHWYAVGSTQTADAYRAKAATAWSLLTGRGDHSVAVVLVTGLRDEGSAGRTAAANAAADRLEAAAAAIEPAISGIALGRTARSTSLVRADGAGPVLGSSPLPAAVLPKTTSRSQ